MAQPPTRFSVADTNDLPVFVCLVCCELASWAFAQNSSWAPKNYGTQARCMCCNMPVTMNSSTPYIATGIPVNVCKLIANLQFFCCTETSWIYSCRGPWRRNIQSRDRRIAVVSRLGSWKMMGMGFTQKLMVFTTKKLGFTKFNSWNWWMFAKVWGPQTRPTREFFLVNSGGYLNGRWFTTQHEVIWMVKWMLNDA